MIQWGRDDVRINCTSFQALEHYQRFGMSEEDTPMYLCHGVTFDIQKNLVALSPLELILNREHRLAPFSGVAHRR